MGKKGVEVSLSLPSWVCSEEKMFYAERVI